MDAGSQMLQGLLQGLLAGVSAQNSPDGPAQKKSKGLLPAEEAYKQEKLQGLLT